MKDRLYIDALFRSGLAEGYGIDIETLKSKSWEEQSAFYWMVMNHFVFNYLKENERYMIISYEDVCAAPFKVARDIFHFSNLIWTPQTESFLHELVSSEVNATGYFSIKRALNSSVQKWKRELRTEQITKIEDTVGVSQIWKLYYRSRN